MCPNNKFEKLRAMSINLDKVFYDDYHGVKWETSPDSIRLITWSGENDSLRIATGGVKNATAHLDPYMNNLRKAFSVWDDSIDRIEFVETNIGNSADITVAITDGLDTDGYWSSTWDRNKYITKSTIELINSLGDELLMTTAMHEIGNVLGLGDIEPSLNYQSVQEDPFPEYFNGNELWSYDKQLINVIYPNFAGEPVPTPTPTPTPTTTPTQDVVSNVLTLPSQFKKKSADKITNFNPSTDILEIDTDSFGIDSSATFAAGKNKKAVKKQLAKQDFDFLYDQKKGGLYFNENGVDKGFGGGGIIAILKGAPELTAENIDFV